MQLQLPDARFNLDVGSGSHGEQTGKMLSGLERILQNEKPGVVLVEGDSVVGDTTIVFQNTDGNIKLMSIEEFADLFFHENSNPNMGKEEVPVRDWMVLSSDNQGFACFKRVKSIIRHNASKKIFRIRTLESEVSITEDHSLFTLQRETIATVTPAELNSHLLLKNIPPIKNEKTISLLKSNLIHPEMWENLFLYVPKSTKIDKEIVSNSRDSFKHYLEHYNRISLSDSSLAKLDAETFSRCFLSNNYHSYGYRIKPCLDLTEELCWILGFYMAEGSFIKSPDGTKKLYIYNKNMDTLEKIRNNLENIFEVKLPVPKYYDSANVGRLVLPLVFVYILIEVFECGIAEKKKVPPLIYHLPLKLKEKFLEGYMAGDGYLKEQEVVTKSRTILDSLIFLLITMGITYTIKFNRYKRRRKNIYALKMPKSNRHGNNNKGKTYRERPFNDVKDMEIREKEIVRNESVVYDLSVEGTERFVTAHGVILHNTNTVLAGALAATKLGIKVGHVEAGLRSYDRRMPEEINRVVADHVSDYLFAPTEKSGKILLGEGIPDHKIFVTGNTVVDAVYQNLDLSKSHSNVLKELGLNVDDYLLATVHRQENVDEAKRLRNIMDGLERVSKELGYSLVCPLHPRTRKRLAELGIEPQVILAEPLDYLSFLQLESRAKLVLTDSGGVQEETCILGVPCVTLRDNTERPETLEVGSNVLAGTNPDKIVEEAKLILHKNKGWVNPFGDGQAAYRIIDVLRRELE